MEIIISKTDFETAMPVGKSAHEEVFENVRPAIDEVTQYLASSMMGDAGMQMISEATEETTLIRFFKKLVCLTAFLNVFRQLDIVITPTGFGVVSNQNITPASKQRVDALEAHLMTEACRTKAMVLNLLRGEQWGDTPQAMLTIPYLYDEYKFFFVRRKVPCTAKDWAAMTKYVALVDELLRLTIGNEMMDEIMTAYRRNDREKMKAFSPAMMAMDDLADRYVDLGDDVVKTRTFRKMIEILEADLDSVYLTYKNSNAYKLNHHENFQNTSDSPAFVFNG